MTEDQSTNVEKLVLKSYLAMVRSSLGATVWQHFYARVDGEELDVMYGGKNACAWFVSGVLIMQKLISSSHATVRSTIKDLERSGWEKVGAPRPGAIILYEPLRFLDGSEHEHLAIYIGEDKAVSTSYEKAVPSEHDWRYRDHDERKIAAIYWLPSLEKNQLPSLTRREES